MPDLALKYSNDLGGMDLAIIDDDLAPDAGLETSALLSEFIDRRAADEDVLLQPEDKRGWWGDQFAEVDGDQLGSRLWQLDRALLTEDIAPQTSAKVKEAYGWMLADGVAARVDVMVEVGARSLSRTTTITRPTGDQINFRYTGAWEAQDAISAG